MIKASEGYYGDSLGTLVGNDVENVLSWANHMGVQAVEQEVGAAAGYLMMSIPFLAFAIFFGAQKMAGMATSMLNVSQGAAIDTGREAATGNVSLGNTNMHNMSANKWNTSHVRDEGRYTEALSDGTMLMQNADGSQTYGTGSAQSSTGFAANIGQSVRSEVSERLSDSQRAVESHSSDFSQSLSNASAQVSDFARTASDSRTAGTGISTTMSEDERTSVSESWRKIEDFAQNNGMSTDMALKAAIAASTPGGGAKILGVSGTADMSASESERFTKAINSSEIGELSSAASTIVSAAEKSFSDSSSSEGQNAANTLRSTLDNVQSSASRLSNSYDQTSALERANALVQSNEGGSRTNITDAFLSEVRAGGYSPEQIGQIFNGKSAQAIQKQQELVDSHMPSLLRELGVNTSGVGAGPDMSGVRNEPLPMQHQPIDTSAAQQQVQTPQVGNYAARDAQAKGLHGANVDSALDRVGADGTRIQQDADTHRHSVEEGADRAIAGAFVSRGKDKVEELANLAQGVFSGGGGGSGTNRTEYGSGFMGSGAPQAGMLSSFAMNSMPAQSGAGPAGALSMRIRPAGVEEGMATSSHGAIDHRGFYQARNIDYAITDSTIRDQPVQPAIMARLSGIVSEMGGDLGIVVTSGGQPSTGDDRTGSHRHDDGNSVDFYLTQNGQRVNPGDDKALYSQFIENSAGDFEGMGHYSWGMHVGGGGAAFWGPDKTAATADPDFVDAYQRGRS
jgi:conjugal transfer mating pair stabilization protein TraG